MGSDTYLAAAKVESPGVETALESHKAPWKIGTVVDLVEGIADIISNILKVIGSRYLQVGYGRMTVYCRYSSAPG